MDLGLKDKVALITGAGSQIGFGKAIALTLAQEGCDLILNDIDVTGVEKTKAEVESLGRKAIAVKADIANRAEVDEMLKRALAEFGKIDILVNNAGASSPFKMFAEKPKDEWDFDINVNLYGPMNVTHAVIPDMLSRKSGKIVNISSAVGRTGMPNSSTYSAAKAGVIALSQALARELIPSGINVNCIAPGGANTGLAKDAPPGFLEKIATTIPIGRLTEPQDIANIVTFLVSDNSSDIVGQTFSVNGGSALF